MEDGGRRLKSFFSHRFSQMKHRWGLGAGHEARYLAGKAIFVRLLALTPALSPGERGKRLQRVWKDVSLDGADW